MGIFDGRSKQILQTEINRMKMYNPERKSEVNVDGVNKNHDLTYSALNKKPQHSIVSPTKESK